MGEVTLEGSLFVADRLYIVYLRSPLVPVDPSFRALSGRLKFTVRCHKFNKDSLSRVYLVVDAGQALPQRLLLPPCIACRRVAPPSQNLVRRFPSGLVSPEWI